jgi:glycosyltransferase involved in cell wall biosynthesis
MPNTLSVAIITFNEEANLPRTLASLRGVREKIQEIVVVDSDSTDASLEIARNFGARVFSEPWKGFAAQKNSAIAHATGDWVLSLDADEEVSPELAREIGALLAGEPSFTAYRIPRLNHFLGKPLRHGGYWPDPKLRLFRRGSARFVERPVHETLQADGPVGRLKSPLLHHCYPTLSDYIEHTNRYSSLGAEMVVAKSNGKVRFSVINIVLRPLATFIYNYFFRLGFLDGREGLLLHLYHAVYVSCKYAKAWELSRKQNELISKPEMSS